jgi:hypothetical protein
MLKYNILWIHCYVVYNKTALPISIAGLVVSASW